MCICTPPVPLLLGARSTLSTQYTVPPERLCQTGDVIHYVSKKTSLVPYKVNLLIS